MKTIFFIFIFMFLSSQIFSQSKKRIVKNFNKKFEITCNQTSITFDNNFMAQLICNDSEYAFSLCDVSIIKTKFDNSIEENIFTLSDGTEFPAVCIPISNPIDHINSFLNTNPEEDLSVQFAILKSKYCNK